VEEAAVTLPDFDQMTKEEIIEWFNTTDGKSALIATMVPSTAPVAPLGPDGMMLLTSIRVPLRLMEQIEAFAEAAGASRSEIIRDAMAAYVREKTTPVGRDEAEHALEVLRKVVEGRTEPTHKAA
jgi:predicted DNA-binding protein